ncbi:MAG: Gfo/Idh/MocA family protein [Candidatus Sifarchaeia archaeon]
MSVNVALIGLGQWGMNHLAALKRLEKLGKVGQITLNDSNLAYGKKIAKEYNLPFEADIDSIIDNSQIDAIHIVTPPDTHFSIGNKALSAGKHVLIEKPLAMTTQECDILIDKSEKNSCILMVGHIFRYHPAIRKLAELLSTDYFGSVYSIDIIRKAMRVPRDDSGVLHSLAIHDVDLACYLFNQSFPTSIYSVSQSFFRDYPDESSIILMQFPNSGFAKIESTWLNPTQQSIRTLELIGSQRSAFIDLLTPDKLIINHDHIEKQNGELTHIKSKSEAIETYPGMPLDIEIAHFLECVISGNEPLTPGHIGRNAIALIELAIKSIHSRKVQKIDG